MGGHKGEMHEGTSGSKAIVSADTAPIKSAPGHYGASPGLRNHLESAKDGGARGINGGHEKTAFEKKLQEIGGRVIEETDIPGIEGVKSVRYEVPKKDKRGNPTSEMRTISAPKSVYDKNVISTDEYMRRGLEAASVRYEVPKKDKRGNPTSEMRTISAPKSVYDKNVISTDEYMRRGLEAANNTAAANGGSLNRSWEGADNNGVKWKGYLDSDNNISTLYPTI